MSVSLTRISLERTLNTVSSLLRPGEPQPGIATGFRRDRGTQGRIGRGLVAAG